MLRAVFLLTLIGCTSPSLEVQRVERPTPLRLGDAPVWPAEGAVLGGAPVVVPEDWTPHVIAIDPGHGTGNNRGATRFDGVMEQDVTLRISEALARHLRRSTRHDVLLLRTDNQGPSYRERVSAMQEAGVELVVSVHGDVRLEGVLDQQAGFSVLYSDEHAQRTAGRRRWANVMGARLRDAGFVPFSGTYMGDYEATAAGVFADRHAPRKRIFMLRATTAPTVIVETHHLLDPAEVARWEEERTIAVFAHAVEGAIIDYFTEGH